MTELKQVGIVASLALIGMIFLFVMQWNATGLMPYRGAGAAYRERVCTKVVPDTTLPLSACLMQARQLCAEVHIPYISQTTKYNTCYNTCVQDAQSLCYE